MPACRITPRRRILSDGESYSGLSVIADQRQVLLEGSGGGIAPAFGKIPVNGDEYFGEGETGHGAYGAPASLMWGSPSPARKEGGMITPELTGSSCTTTVIGAA